MEPKKHNLGEIVLEKDVSHEDILSETDRQIDQDSGPDPGYSPKEYIAEAQALYCLSSAELRKLIEQDSPEEYE